MYKEKKNGCEAPSSQMYQTPGSRVTARLLGSKLKFSTGSNILYHCSAFSMELLQLCVCVFVQPVDIDIISSSTLATDNLCPFPVTDTVKVKPLSKTKNGAEASERPCNVPPSPPLGCASSVKWWNPLWRKRFFILMTVQWEGSAANADGFVNKSSELSQVKSSNNRGNCESSFRGIQAQILRHQFH